jgi:hypothetical protein
MQIWNSKYAEFVSIIILNIEISCADIFHEINGNFKEANLIRHRKVKITCIKDYRWFDFVMLVNKNIAFLRVEHPVFW